MRRTTAHKLRVARTWAAVLVGVLVLGGWAAFVRANTGESDLTAEEVRALNEQYADELAAKARKEAKAELKAATTLDVQQPAKGPLTVMFVGDSLTEGYYATTEDDTYVPRVARGLGRDVTVLRTNPARGKVSKVVDRIKVDPDVDLAVVELGTNDVDASSKDMFEASYAALLDKIGSESEDMPLLCLGVWYVDDQGFDDIIRDECEARSGEFVNMNAMVRDDRNISQAGDEAYLGTADGFYPNDRGHKKIAKAILGQIEVAPAPQ